ncbi:MAG: beta-propeller domain-containing protein, partial [Acidobacteriota bacterium]
NSLSTGQCQSFFRPTDSHARGVATIISFDLLGSDFFWDADHVIANYPTFYESQNDIVLAEGAHDWWWYWWYPDDTDQVNIHVFDGTQPGHSAYIASGRVDGQLVDQFSIDELDGAIRLATTTGAWERWWNTKAPNPESHVWVLRQQGDRFAIAGHVGGITPGEHLTATRFVGNQAFLTTYQYVDPLITVDLSDPTAPAIAGQLKVPGFSTYLQSIGNGKLLAIGYEGSPSWSTDVSMFDVSSFTNPQLQTTLPLAPEQGWAWSEATWDHKAFQYWGPKQLLAIPESNYAYDSTTGYYSYLSKLQLVTVDPNNGLSFYGAIDHSAFYDSDPNHYWSYVDIRRSIFMGDYVYAISDRAVTAHRVSDLGQVAAQPLPGYSPGDLWWWW